MYVEHEGRRPQVHPTSWIAPSAVLSGDVSVGPETAVLYGAVLTAEAGGRIEVGSGAMVFNGARLGDACVVALGGKVHIDTELLEGTRVPIGYIAYGRPAVI